MEFGLSSSPSNEYSGLISFRIDWLDLLVVQGTLKSLLQHHSSKASILCCLAFFIVHLSHPYLTTGKTIALTRGTFVDKVMSLLFNMLSRLVIREGDEFVSHRYVWEGGSCLGMHVHPWWIHVNVWQNQYKFKNKKGKRKKNKINRKAWKK